MQGENLFKGHTSTPLSMTILICYPENAKVGERLACIAFKIRLRRFIFPLLGNTPSQ